MEKLLPAQRSALMARVRNRNTAAEMMLRRAMWAIGIRYRLGQRIGRIQPDIVFSRACLAVFVDGCFWHCCPLHGTKPKSNIAFWKEKLDRNVARDRRSTVQLRRSGWVVLRFWEHEVEADSAACARKVAEALADCKVQRGEHGRCLECTKN